MNIAESRSDDEIVLSHEFEQIHKTVCWFIFCFNKFSFFSYSEGKADFSGSQYSESEHEFESTDLLTPLGKRIPRERHVKASAKSIDVIQQFESQ